MMGGGQQCGTCAPVVSPGLPWLTPGMPALPRLPGHDSCPGAAGGGLQVQAAHGGGGRRRVHAAQREYAGHCAAPLVARRACAMSIALPCLVARPILPQQPPPSPPVQVARCWTYETARLMGIDLPDQLPDSSLRDFNYYVRGGPGGGGDAKCVGRGQPTWFLPPLATAVRLQPPTPAPPLRGPPCRWTRGGCASR
jgi:hypothetical protein